MWTETLGAKLSWPLFVILSAILMEVLWKIKNTSVRIRRVPVWESNLRSPSKRKRTLCHYNASSVPSHGKWLLMTVINYAEMLCQYVNCLCGTGSCLNRWQLLGWPRISRLYGSRDHAVLLAEPSESEGNLHHTFMPNETIQGHRKRWTGFETAIT